MFLFFIPIFIYLFVFIFPLLERLLPAVSLNHSFSFFFYPCDRVTQPLPLERGKSTPQKIVALENNRSMRQVHLKNMARGLLFCIRRRE